MIPSLNNNNNEDKQAWGRTGREENNEGRIWGLFLQTWSWNLTASYPRVSQETLSQPHCRRSPNAGRTCRKAEPGRAQDTEKPRNLGSHLLLLLQKQGCEGGEEEVSPVPFSLQTTAHDSHLPLTTREPTCHVLSPHWTWGSGQRDWRENKERPPCTPGQGSRSRTHDKVLLFRENNTTNRIQVQHLSTCAACINTGHKPHNEKF